MQFKRCISCGLTLPLNVLKPIQIRHNGKIMVVPICNTCENKKIQESKRRMTNETN